MPVLLAPGQAPTLHELLADANTIGLGYEIVDLPGRPTPAIQGLSSLLAAGPTEISFLSNRKLQSQLQDCVAAAVIMEPDVYAVLPAGRRAYGVVLCSQPYLLYALLAQWFDRHRLTTLETGIHPSAVVDPSASIANGVSIGAFCVIGAQARIGQGSRLGPACIVGEKSTLGRDCLLHARVTLYHGVAIGDRAILHSGVVLGADGFGFAPNPEQTPGAWLKIAQLGGVVVGDDVEIGANTTIDRGALDNTEIGNGVKIDNQIMIGHNCKIGDYTAMAGCVGIAGSTTIGKRCTIGGAAMLAGHLVLADDVHISGGTAVTSDIRKPGRYTGVYPLAEHSQWQRNTAVVSRLALLRRRLNALSKGDQ
ncbi:MAG: UDP-3-O-(3-hydroxymyristoyl)glucosamine N-acyltransferase [Burkholderiaceae bacterium]